MIYTHIDTDTRRATIPCIYLVDNEFNRFVDLPFIWFSLVKFDDIHLCNRLLHMALE